MNRFRDGQRGPAVSVLLRAWNRPAGLRTAIESALTQTHTDLEVVVSDDSGALEAVATGFGDPRVKYYANPAPAGPAANLRRAASLARGRFFAILCDDDRWLESFLESTVAILKRDPAVGVVFTDHFLEVGGLSIRHGFPYAPGRHDRLLTEILEHSIPASANLMRREVWEDGECAVPLRDNMIGDNTTWLRAASGGHPFYYLPESLAVTRIHPGQVSWSEDGLSGRLIATLNAFRFHDPLAEDLRRARLSEALFARAGSNLRARRPGAFWHDLRSALAVTARPPGLRVLLAVTGARHNVARLAVRHPRAGFRALWLWSRIRPPALRGHSTAKPRPELAGAERARPPGAGERSVQLSRS